MLHNNRRAMLKQAIAAATLILSHITVFAQQEQVPLSGNVVAKGGAAIPGANVWLKHTYDGASTDAEGRFYFSIETTQPDNLVLCVAFVGLEHRELPLRDGTTEVQVQLREVTDELRGVIITAGSIDASYKARSMVMRPHNRRALCASLLLYSPP